MTTMRTDELVRMLNDSTTSRNSKPPATSERRIAARRSLSEEVVVSWHFDPTTPVRYQTCDISDSGLRITTSMPLIDGMTGHMQNLAAASERIEESVMVAWCRPAPDGEYGYQAGLRFF